VRASGYSVNYRAVVSVLAFMQLRIARLILTVVLVGGAILSFALDWTDNHLLNPAWHAHARFHGALLLFLLAGVSLTGVWLLWRKSTEPEVAIKVAALIAASFWTPLFYVTLLLPGSSAWAGDPAAVPHLAGRTFYPNMAVGGGFLVAIALAGLMGARKSIED
jgi:hypothetical protein